jgi:hypothetical protein
VLFNSILPAVALPALPLSQVHNQWGDRLAQDQRHVRDNEEGTERGGELPFSKCQVMEDNDGEPRNSLGRHLQAIGVGSLSLQSFKHSAMKRVAHIPSLQSGHNKNTATSGENLGYNWTGHSVSCLPDEQGMFGLQKTSRR